MYSLKNLFGGSDYKSSLFTQEEIDTVEQAAYTKIVRGKEIPFIRCFVRQKEIQLKPEEAVRQLFIQRLIKNYGYKISQMQLEHPVRFGTEVNTKYADIVIFEKNRPQTEYIIVELKKPKLKDGKEQLKTYCNSTGATMGVWTNGESISFYHRKDPNYFEDIPDIPREDQKLKDILGERWTINDLIEKDKLLRENKTLADLIREMEDEVLANAGVDVFEEVFKLIYTKLYDEMMSGRDEKRFLEFRNYGDTDADLKELIQKLFDNAKKKWQGVFAKDDKIKLTSSHLAVCVSSLQNVKLFNSNLEVVDEAFEYLMSKSQKGEKGQYFTPRYVIDMCVKMLNPKRHEKMIDTAAGSCGFPVHTIFYVWKNILEEKNIRVSHLFSSQPKPPECEDYVNENVFAIDFDEKAVRVARTLNLIAGDGKTNVLHLNTLDYGLWEEVVKDEDWIDIYHEGWKGLRALRAAKNDNSKFNFDIVMANPPFAGDIKESKITMKYELGKNAKGKYQSKVSRDILFIERNLNFLKPGGRMAIVLPQGRFNNSSDKYIRDFIAERCRILAVVGLHGNVFKPHTGTKTSVLFVQKWDDELCPRRDDYPIFFATMRKPSKDNSGRKIYLLSDKEDEFYLRDTHGHIIVDHDLFNHDGLTQDGIAEAFIEFAKKEHLSFFDSSSFDELKYKNLSEGLECTEIFFNDIDDNLFRIEAEYYSKKYLFLEKKLANYTELGKLTKKIECGPFGSNLLDTEYKEEGVLVVRPFNLKNSVVEEDNLVYISENLVKKNNLKLYNEGTLLFARVGDIKIGILNRKIATISPNIIAVEFQDKNISKFFAVFFNTYSGFTQIERQLKIAAQPTISTDIIKKLKVPTYKNLTAKVITIFDEAHEKLIQAKEKYSAAEKILEQSLGLDNFKPSTENISVKNFSQSFATSGRLDAEFYQPKYDDIEKKILKFPRIKIKDIIDYPVSSGSTPKAGDSEYYTDKENGIPFIRAVDITDGRVDTKNFIYIKPGVHNKLLKRTKLKSQDVLFSIAGTVGRCGIFDYAFEANINQAVAILRFPEIKIKRLYLIQFFNSKIGKWIVEKYSRQGLQTNLNLEEVAELSIPIIDEGTQKEISAKVEESFRLREESKKLLELAKKSVEIAIEQNEEAAIKFLTHAR